MLINVYPLLLLVPQGSLPVYPVPVRPAGIPGAPERGRFHWDGGVWLGTSVSGLRTSIMTIRKDSSRRERVLSITVPYISFLHRFPEWTPSDPRRSWPLTLLPHLLTTRGFIVRVRSSGV